MAVLTITAGNVRPLPGALVRRYPAASTNVTVGSFVYVKNDGKIELADADDQTQCQARGIVVAIGAFGKTTAAVGDMCDVVVFGPVAIGSDQDMVEGGVGYISPTAGKIDQSASATSGDFNYIIGFAESPTIFFVQGQLTVPTAVS
jgi:hypothetical protein